MTVVPGAPGTAVVSEISEPLADAGAVLVEGLLVGICGTDVEIVRGGHGRCPPGEDRLVLGHESLGRVLAAPPESGLAPGDLVAGIVRRPDPLPCEPCAQGRWDFCRNGGFTERGIKELPGYGAERWRVDSRYAVRVDAALDELGVLVEPASVASKAWDRIELLARGAPWTPRTVLVTGAGPIGLLSALVAVQRGYDVHVLDLVTEGPKPGLVADLGATYHQGSVGDLGFAPDLAVECTGVGALAFDVVEHVAPGGVVCLTGISGGRPGRADLSAVNRDIVLGNTVVFGAVNAARAHYEEAVQTLAAADHGWLSRLVSRRVPLDRWPAALQKGRDDVKVVVELR
ncbi:MAG: glucose 1-dehydrogenase [Streptomycetales bacterium]